MKKCLAVLMVFVLLISAAACGSGEGQTGESEPQSTESTAESESVPANTGSNVLTAYFTWADNTVVENPDAVDTDATTSASVLAPGNAARLAGWIQEEVGGDLFSIKVEEPYSSDYDDCLDRAADEKAEDARPALSSHVENMDQYDTIFLGYPNWWYTCPMAIHSFIEEYDLEDKTIVLFCTHGTGGLASSVEDIKASLPENCKVSDNVLGVYREDVSGAQDDVRSWLAELGFEGGNES